MLCAVGHGMWPSTQVLLCEGRTVCSRYIESVSLGAAKPWLSWNALCRLALNSRGSCLCLSSAKGIHHRLPAGRVGLFLCVVFCVGSCCGLCCVCFAHLGGTSELLASVVWRGFHQ